MKQTNKRCERLLEFIIAYKRAHDGNSPTIREMCFAVESKTTSVVNYYLVQLERQGRIVMSKGASRSICVVGGHWRYEPEILSQAHGGDELTPSSISKTLEAVREIARLAISVEQER